MVFEAFENNKHLQQHVVVVGIERLKSCFEIPNGWATLCHNFVNLQHLGFKHG